MLLKIPGINTKNVKRIMSNVENLHDLCQMSEERLSEVLENSKAAKQVYEFLNASIKSSEEIDQFVDSKKTPMPGTSASTSGRNNGKKNLNTKSKSGSLKRTNSSSSLASNAAKISKKQ